MRKILTFLFSVAFYLFLGQSANGQIINGDVFLGSQAQVDGFNATQVNGTVIVTGSGITNLNGLSELTKCTELHILTNPALTSIIGLANLQEVQHTLDVRNNLTLTSLTGFSSLTFVGAFLNISGNSSLTDLDGLFNLEEIGSDFGNLTIANNNVLTDVDGLAKLTVVPSLIIKDNPSLVDIDGLSNLETIQYGGIIIENNAALTNINGLHKIDELFSDLEIINNASLTNIDGLSNLTVIWNIQDGTENLEIRDNPSLANIDGLSTLFAVQDGNLVIHNNDALTNIDALSNLGLVGQLLVISNNLLLENVDGLSSLTKINGLVIGRNNALTNLDGLSGLFLVVANISIELNPSLTDFCGLSNLLKNGIIGGTITIKNNGANTLSVTPPPDIILNNDPGLCSKDISAVAPYVATVTGCLNPEPPSRSGHDPDNIYPVGTTNIIWSATDAAGNTATAVQKVIITDNEAPVITQFPTNVTVVCAADVPAANIGLVTATDNCNVTVSHVGDVVTNRTCANRYTLIRTYKATDGSSNTATRSQIITVNDNIPPQITGLTISKQILTPPNHKMQDITVDYSVIDNCNSSQSYTFNVTSNEPVNGTGDGDTDPDWQIIDDHHIRLRAERAANGDGRIYTITITANDGCNAAVSSTAQVVVAHNITGPHSGQSFRVGSTVIFGGEFWDVPTNKHTAKWLIDGSTTAKATVTEPSGNKNGKVTGSYKFSSPGVYKLQMNVTDQNGVLTYANTNGDLEAIVVIYDPNGGHTYGGGYFDSPAGSLISDPSATGKASFGFAMNYFKNSTYPKGETQFEFKVGDFEFNALNFDYLVISNSMAQFKGTGKIIGGQSGIGFTMTVTDGQLDGTGADKVRMKIYNKNNGIIIYDNQPGASDAALPVQAVGLNSSIVISGSNSSLTSTNINQKAEMEAKVAEVSNNLEVIAFPNPSANNFNINVRGITTEKMTMQVVDMYGRVIETRNITANSITRFGDRYRPGTYFVRVRQGQRYKQLKLIKLSD